MYSKELLENEYFKSLAPSFTRLKVETLLDSLTGVILRNHIIDYAKYLIENNIPFAFQIIDLDNFKLVNDNYGHAIGDELLINFAKRLEEAVGNKGLVGRYGGDEFIIVYPNIHTYDDVHGNVKDLFGEGGPLRNNYILNGKTLYMTGTIGSASFPDNAKDFDDLFHKADKALYRGKQKGRNCFIIYVHEKHKDINVNSRNKNDLHSISAALIKTIEGAKSFEDAIKSLNDVLIEAINMSELVFLPENDPVSENLVGLSNDYGIFTTASLEFAMGESKIIGNYMEPRGIQSLISYKINCEGQKCGTLLMTETKIHRIWQDDDMTIMMLIGELLFYKFLSK